MEKNVLAIDFLIFNFSNNRLFRHDTHEIVSWVTVIRARETNAGEVLGGKLSVVVINDLTSSDEEKLIELVIGFSVRLMDSRDNSFTILVGKLLKHLNDLGSCPRV